MDNFNGHGGFMATGVHEGQTQEDENNSSGAQENPQIDGEGADCQEMGEGWGDPNSYTLANRTTTPTRAEVEGELAILSRSPFARILADYLGFSPTPAALRRFANKSPDKWASSLGILADLAGYKKGVVEVSNVLMVGSMDDAALLRRLRETELLLAEQQRLIVQQEPTQYPRELAPSRDPDIIDVASKKIE